jgi:hypothetical protein
MRKTNKKCTFCMSAEYCIPSRYLRYNCIGNWFFCTLTCTISCHQIINVCTLFLSNLVITVECRTISQEKNKVNIKLLSLAADVTLTRLQGVSYVRVRFTTYIFLNWLEISKSTLDMMYPYSSSVAGLSSHI